jgi:hypothetical protein
MSPRKSRTDTIRVPVRGRPRRPSEHERARMLAEMPPEAIEALRAEVERREATRKAATR